VKSIQNYVDDGQLKSSSELYYPVRLKPAGQNTLENLEKNGIDHIELRCIDLNPLSEIGLKKEDVEFLHFLLLYLSNIMTDTFEVFQQVMAIKNAKKAAMLDDTEIMIETGWNKSCNIRELTLDILNDMESFYQSLENAKAVSIVKYQKEKIIYPQNRYAVQIKAKFEHNYVEKGLAMLEKYADKG
jgi:glutamate--cysteine ligase